MKGESLERFLEMAECYHEMAPYLVPNYVWLQKSALEFLRPEEEDEHPYLVDLGGGSGRMILRYLQAYPTARACLVDSSSSFIELAKSYLGEVIGRVDFIESPIEDNWEKDLRAAPSAVFSMSCIHHFPADEKSLLFRKAAKVLRPNGKFMNVDEMRDVDDAVYLSDMEYWWHYGLNQKDQIPADKRKYYDLFMSHFKKWKIRNIDQRDLPKSKGDDMHQTVDEQLKMLRQFELSVVGSYFSFRLWNAIGGKKIGHQMSR